MRTSLRLLALLLVPLLVACEPPDDDDDPCEVEGALDEDLDEDGEPDCSDATPTGTAPVIHDVLVCEVAVLPDDCAGNLAAEFQISLTDEDCDLNNVPYVFTEDGVFLVEGIVEQNFECGTLLHLRLCSEWARGFDFSYELWVRDALGNQSNLWEDTWLVPAQAGDDNCPPP